MIIRHFSVVKITPAHDPNNFEVGNRHNLERVIVMNPDTTMNENDFKYEGMIREECSEESLKNIEKVVDNKIEFIKNFRNVKAENNISKDAKVILNTDDEIIIKMLKLENNLIDKPLDINTYQVSNGNLKATIYYEKEITKEELEQKQKNIDSLKLSIERRKKLLANENYIAKAPQNLVEQEKNKLAEEEKQLKELIK